MTSQRAWHGTVAWFRLALATSSDTRVSREELSLQRRGITKFADLFSRIALSIGRPFSVSRVHKPRRASGQKICPVSMERRGPSASLAPLRRVKSHGSPVLKKLRNVPISQESRQTCDSNPQPGAPGSQQRIRHASISSGRPTRPDLLTTTRTRQTLYE